MQRRKPLSALPSFIVIIPAMVVDSAGALCMLMLICSPLMRWKWFSDRTWRITKKVNRFTGRYAGTRLGMLSFNLVALHHVGRRSGRRYVTLLTADPLGDGFVLGRPIPKWTGAPMCLLPGSAC